MQSNNSRVKHKIAAQRKVAGGMRFVRRRQWPNYTPICDSAPSEAHSVPLQMRLNLCLPNITHSFHSEVLLVERVRNLISARVGSPLLHLAFSHPAVEAF
jgi:hypothetical protein